MADESEGHQDLEFGLLVPFPDDSQSFALGFEAGMYWTLMREGRTPLEPVIPIRADNLDLFDRMAAATGYDMEFSELLDGGWVYFTATKKRPRFGVIEGGKHASE